MAERAPSEVKDTLKRIEEHPNVVGVIIMDRDGQPVHSTLDAMETAYYIRQCSSLTAIARGTIRETDPTDDLQFFRIRTKKFEIMLAPERDYLLIVLQNTTKTPGKFAWGKKKTPCLGKKKPFAFTNQITLPQNLKGTNLIWTSAMVFYAWSNVFLSLSEKVWLLFRTIRGLLCWVLLYF